MEAWDLIQSASGLLGLLGFILGMRAVKMLIVARMPKQPTEEALTQEAEQIKVPDPLLEEFKALEERVRVREANNKQPLCRGDDVIQLDMDGRMVAPAYDADKPKTYRGLPISGSTDSAGALIHQPMKKMGRWTS